MDSNSLNRQEYWGRYRGGAFGMLWVGSLILSMFIFEPETLRVWFLPFMVGSFVGAYIVSHYLAEERRTRWEWFRWDVECLIKDRFEDMLDRRVGYLVERKMEELLHERDDQN